ncbi:thiamine phosphate synthase [Litchfieldia salsa]|uniref:Thiamine-phosphate synthase n=1 Tax=Litchfieldia salsa TaxID=930152 RepID=A0A1H0UXF0_9BACI|nr:thiamine phosphate synthase [Litchfieldia salsa]SDP70959.1 thiamine-phosphate diphosphorylase [Litchfieldia salsa]
MNTVRDMLKLYFVMGSPNCTRNPRQVLKESIDGGVTLFQLREKGHGALQGEEKRQLAKELQAICKENNVPFIVNDDVDLAIELQADGVHIGQEDEPIDAVKTKIGSMLLGVSTHNIEEALLAIEKGADYIGVGPMYETKTKSDARDVMGPLMIKNMRSEGIEIPIVGIGGISLGKVRDVMNAGSDGVAVVSAISLANSAKDAAEELMNEIRSSD